MRQPMRSPYPLIQRGPEARTPRSLRDVPAGFITTCTGAPETTQHSDSVVVEEGGRLNNYAIEPEMYVDSTLLGWLQSLGR
jgi:hypothetical protein